MSKQKYFLPIIALIIANLLWGVNAIFIKLGVESIPPVIFMSIRFLVASLIILPFAIRTWKPLKRKDLLLLILSSIFYISLSSFAFNLGLSMTSASNASIIWLLTPPLLFVLSVVFLKEKLSLKAFIGISVALAGSLIIIGRPWEGGASGADGFTGNLLVVIAVVCNAISTLICKPIMKRVGAWQVTFMNMFPGVVLVSLYALTQLGSWDVAATTTRSYTGLVLGTLAVIGANCLFFYALRYKTVHTTVIYNYIDPIAAVAAAWFILAERPSPVFAFGALLVCAGIYLVERHKSRKR